MNWNMQNQMLRKETTLREISGCFWSLWSLITGQENQNLIGMEFTPHLTTEVLCNYCLCNHDHVGQMSHTHTISVFLLKWSVPK